MDEFFTISDETAAWLRTLNTTRQIGARFTTDESRLHVRAPIPDDPDALDDRSGEEED